MWRFLKKIEKVASVLLLIAGLLIPLLIFANRFLIPDVSADSLNYHYYLGFKGLNSQNNKFEFYPTGIHNFSPVLDTVGYAFSQMFGYRLGTMFSIVVIYLSVWAIYKIFKLILPDKKITDELPACFLFVSSFLSFELFLGIASYFVDGLVATGALWCIYYLLKYSEKRDNLDLFSSMILMSVLVVGKQTNLYLVPAYFLVLLLIEFGKKQNALKVIGKLAAVGILIMAIPSVWYFQNWKLSGNPVFPFYNAIFKSEYFEPVNFVETQFGGKNLAERILWFYYSLLDPKRLGQVHDLFNDFKLNAYVGVLVVFTPVYLLLVKNKNKTFNFLLMFFGIGYLLWSLEFGYLRYGLVLEYVGGLMLLIAYFKLGKYRYVIVLPLLAWLLIQNKRVVNMSLAYDISFRQGFFYNQLSYPKELNKLKINKIAVNKNVSDFGPNIYLNCAIGGMSYYALSPFNNLPVINIDTKAYSQMTGNLEYKKMVIERVLPYLADKSEIKFVTIAAETGLNTEYESCLKNLKDKGWIVGGIDKTTFLGFENQRLNVIYGRINKSYFDKMNY